MTATMTVVARRHADLASAIRSKPEESLAESLDARIRVLWSPVKEGETLLDGGRKELGRLLAEKRETFGARGDGFAAWCRKASLGGAIGGRIHTQPAGGPNPPRPGLTFSIQGTAA